ncbi:MAG: FAD-dependent oxidoreductase [Candidatus Woesearchaeota archaeon]|nr:FAD-dependent oxidoreductase [Candidatus Woesearchaeota archaeon]
MYDLIIIGGGPAGLSAAIYAARFMLKTLIITKEVGGAIVEAHKIENWPGYKSISGIDLMKNFKDQVTALGVEIVENEVVDVENKKGFFKIKTNENKTYESKNTLFACGTVRRKLDVKGEKEFTGKGVSYCATCDAAFFRNKAVAVVGGNNSAARAAQLLAEYAKEVHIIYRKEKLRADPILVAQISKNKKIKIINNANIAEIKGDKFVTSVIFDNGKDLKVDGVFVEIGSEPCSAFASKLGVALDSTNHMIVDKAQKTSIKGIYAAGDVTNNQMKQIITACAEGAVAANSVYEEMK